LKGGAEKVIPQYVEPKFNPGIPNEQKQIASQRYGEQQAVADKYKQGQQDKQLINLQVYQPQKPKPEQPKEGINFFPSFNTNPYFPPQMANMFNPYASSMLGAMYPMTVNLNKVYEINTNGPVDAHSKLNMIYEDLIPGKSVSTTFKTLGERLTQIQYIRTILFQNGDSTEINLDGNSSNSLLSHMKFLELNPFNTNRFSDNPYKGMPDGFLIYRTCYPIKRSIPNGQVTCSKDSMALNVRIYRLNTGGYLLNKEKNNKKIYEYNQWREIIFYEYIREYILKKKLCPNFVTLYGYYLCNKSGIKFDKITEINLGKPNQSGSMINPMNDLNIWEKKENDFVTNVVKGLRQLNPGHIIQRLETDKILHNIQPIQKPLDLNAYSGEVIVALTESPTYTLYTWASKIYQQEGNTRRMINTGFHSDNIWKSLIFQLMVALYVMKLHNIYIKNFSIKNNVFIKDLNIEGNIINYWKYRINGIDYYIPNYGYILLIDSNFKDFNLSTLTTVGTSASLPLGTTKTTVGTSVSIGLPIKTDTGYLTKTTETITIETISDDNFLKRNIQPTIKEDYKLDGAIFDVGNTLTTDIDNKFLQMFKEGINPNNFGPDFISEGGTPPDSSIMNILQQIYGDSETNIENYFIKYMNKFMNNRIGTYLKEQEIIHIRNDDLREFKKGQILVNEEGTGLYRFILFLETISGKAKILTKIKTSQNDPQYIDKDKEIIEEKIVQITTLFNYSLTESITQNFKINEANFNEDNLLETYNINVL